MINGTQCRSARSTLRLSRPQLAALAGVSARQVKRFEGGSTQQRASVVDQIEQALAAAGRALSKDDVETLHLILNQLADLVYCISSALMKPQPARELFGEIHRSASKMRAAASSSRQPLVEIPEAAE